MDGFLQPGRVRGLARRQRGDEAFLGELLGDGAADAPAHAHRHVAIVQRLAVRQLGIAAVRLPLRRRPHHHRDGLPVRIHDG
jgi:hypothetical protein